MAEIVYSRTFGTQQGSMPPALDPTQERRARLDHDYIASNPEEIEKLRAAIARAREEIFVTVRAIEDADVDMGYRVLNLSSFYLDLTGTGPLQWHSNPGYYARMIYECERRLQNAQNFAMLNDLVPKGE